MNNNCIAICCVLFDENETSCIRMLIDVISRWKLPEGAKTNR